MHTHKRVVLLEEFFEFNVIPLAYLLKFVEYALFAHLQFSLPLPSIIGKLMWILR